jgi:hypothetical protein
VSTLHDTATGNADASGTTVSCADALTVTAGDLVVVAVKHEEASTTIQVDTGASTPVFSTANAYRYHAGTDLAGYVAYWKATSSGTVTPRAVLAAARAFKQIRAWAFTPAGGTELVLDTVAAAEGTGGAGSAGSASATAAGASVVVLPIYSSVDIAAGSGWTEAAEHGGATSLNGEYRLQTGAGSLTGDWGDTSGWAWIAQMAIFKEVAAGGAAVKTMHLHRQMRN